MNTCPYCQNEQDQVKVGKNKSGSQKYQCKSCGRRYTPEPSQMYPDSLRQQAVRLYVDGMNFRRIGRHLGVDHKTVIHWVNAYSAQLPGAPVPGDVNNAELDELYTFVGHKKTGFMS
jgi:transposase-like protein